MMRRMAKAPAPLLAQIFSDLAPRLGATVRLEPNWKVAGQINFPSGRRRYFRFSSIDLNPLGAAEIAKDKDYANFFMREMGYETIEGQTFFRSDWGEAIGQPKGVADAMRFAAEIGYPVFVKPNSGSQGREAAVAVDDEELAQVMEAAFAIDRVVLVQRVIPGRDYRIVVLHDEVISAYERIPLAVDGDGASTLAELMQRKQEEFDRTGRDTVLRQDDLRIDRKISRSGYDRQSIPRAGERVYLLDNANLSSGGEAVDVTTELHPSVADLAIRLTKDMGLRLCGVDLLIQGDVSKPLADYVIIEVNAAPGLDHYARVGAEQKAIVEAMYLRVMQGMDRD